MAAPWALKDFAQQRVGVAALAAKLGRGGDFSGCYVLLDERVPVYVGISRGVIARLRQHVFGNTHFDASLAYRMAERTLPHERTRGDAMADPLFAETFKKKRDYLRTLSAATVEISNPLELYLFEVYASMEYDTSEWNSFQTH